jgi:hypothetical protein
MVLPESDKDQRLNLVGDAVAQRLGERKGADGAKLPALTKGDAGVQNQFVNLARSRRKEAVHRESVLFHAQQVTCRLDLPRWLPAGNPAPL